MMNVVLYIIKKVDTVDFDYPTTMYEPCAFTVTICEIFSDYCLSPFLNLCGCTFDWYTSFDAFHHDCM